MIVGVSQTIQPGLLACGHIVKSIHRLTIRTGDQVSIRINGQLDRRVPELIAHVGETLVSLNQQRRERVTKIVKSKESSVHPSHAAIQACHCSLVGSRHHAICRPS